MKRTELIMGMPISLEIVGSPKLSIFKNVFDYFRAVDARYSTYKKNSEISRVNRGLPKSQWSREMKQVLELCAETKRLTNGYFNIEHNGQIDPSGLVKGWSIQGAADMLKREGVNNFMIDAGGDIQVNGRNSDDELWRVGIRNPFNREENIKILAIDQQGVATSGLYIRGAHIYNPLKKSDELNEVASLTVVGPNIYEADRFATAAFAMGPVGVSFIEKLKGFEAYSVDKAGLATMTSGFERYVV